MCVPVPAQRSPGLAEYTIEIDGQQLRYRNTAAQWQRFVLPNPGAVPGARISAITLDGRSIEIFNESGAFALEKMSAAAKRKVLAPELYEYSWGAATGAVTVHLKSDQPARRCAGPGRADAPAPKGGPAIAATAAGLRGIRLPALVVGADATAVASLPAASGARP